MGGRHHGDILQELMGHGEGVAQWDDTRVGGWDMGEQTVVTLMGVVRTRGGTHKPHSDTRGGWTAHRGHSEVTPVRAMGHKGHSMVAPVGVAGTGWAQRVTWGVHRG